MRLDYIRKKTTEDQRERRSRIRSFGPSRGRLNAAQRERLSAVAPHRIPTCALAERLKGQALPVVLEIGFGRGDSLYHMAAAMPERLFVGVEVYAAGVAHLLGLLEEAPLPNLWVIRDDAVTVMAALPSGALTKIQLFFPDPWPKKRHHKRRLVQQAWLHEAARLLDSGGYLHLATDWKPYAEHMEEQVAAQPDTWRALVAPHPEAKRPKTKFEERGQRLGCPPTDLLFQRVF